MQGRPHPTAEFRIIGHRGARGHAPENTLAGLRKAVQLGAPWVEIDVQLHQGELLVLHDARLERTTSGQGRLCDYDVAQLRTLDAGNGERIPLLGEVLDVLAGQAGLNVELKTGAGTAAAVAAVLRRALQQGWQAQQLLVSSFIHPELRAFHAELPEVPLGTLFAGVPLDLAAAATQLQAAVVGIAAEFADPRLIADAHARGLRVYAYTVNHVDELLQLRDLGVDGVFTDYPDRMLAALAAVANRAG